MKESESDLMPEPGTPDVRPSDWGPKLTDDWWQKAADALLRRVIGYGGGEGPPQQQTKRLSTAFQVIFHAKDSTDQGERDVRRFLNTPTGSTDQLSITLCDALVTRCGPLIARQIEDIPSSNEERTASPSAAIDNRPPSMRAREGQFPRGVQPRPPSKDRWPPEPGWWQKVIEAKEATFDIELEARERVYEEYVAALDGPQREQFMENALVRPNPFLWRPRFDRALNILRIARGIPGQMSDDAYHYDRSIVPLGLRSESIVGELVHAAWQFDYLAAEPLSAVLAEFMYATPARQGVFPPMRRTPLRDYRQLIGKADDPGWFDSAFWAFGEQQRPDIMDITNRRILEIKPIRSITNGVLQLWRYTHNFNCARYFDELTEAGETGKPAIRVEPQNVRSDVFKPLDLNEFLERYFEGRDEESERDSLRPGWIPPNRRRVRRSEVERTLRAGRKILVEPFMDPLIPGLVFYVIHDQEKREKERSENLLPTAGALFKAVAIVTAIVLVTAVIVTVTLPAAVAGSASAALAESTLASEAASIAASSSAEASVIETFGAGFRIQEFSNVVNGVSDVFGRLVEAGVLN